MTNTHKDIKAIILYIFDFAILISDNTLARPPSACPIQPMFIYKAKS